jgi:hypothetical protein
MEMEQLAMMLIAEKQQGRAVLMEIAALKPNRTAPLAAAHIRETERPARVLIAGKRLWELAA